MTDNQLTRADLAGMTPDAIEKARLEGRLDRVLGRSEDSIAARARIRSGDATLDDIRTADAESIVQARADGLLKHLTDNTDNTEEN